MPPLAPSATVRAAAGQAGLSPAAVPGAIVKAFDRNGDGALSRDELAIRSFDSLDRDGNGRVHLAELHAGIAGQPPVHRRALDLAVERMVAEPAASRRYFTFAALHGALTAACTAFAALTMGAPVAIATLGVMGAVLAHLVKRGVERREGLASAPESVLQRLEILIRG